MSKIAELFKLLCDNYEGAQDLGKKAAQKFFYFFERAGINLNLRFGIHFYGPYSAKLDDDMYELESEGFITINTGGLTHVIQYGMRKVDVTALSSDEMKIAENVVTALKLKSPSELEALSTMDYIAHTISPGASEDEIKEKFKQIKGTKFDQTKVENTWSELQTINFLHSC